MAFDATDRWLSESSVRVRRLCELIDIARRENRFQRPRLAARRVSAIEDIAELPIISKSDLIADQEAHPPFGTNLTFAHDHYTHLHQTSGTTGTTLRVLDTAADWQWVRRCLGHVLSACGVGPSDRVALAYSFGPYLQFWASYAGTESVGALAIPLGGMDSIERLQTIRDYEVTTVLCTPSYATHLAKVAIENHLSDAADSVQRVVCTGEPGASLPAVREEIETLWKARCFDHAGLSEVGPCAYPCAAGGMHLLEDEYIFEILDPTTRAPVPEGQTGELIVTALGRLGFPVIRYSTGDVVRAHAQPCPANHPGRWLPWGILGRTDDMVVIRGMNVFPSAIEELLRQSSGVGEFLITFYRDSLAMDEVKVEAELTEPSEARSIQARMRQRLGLRVRIVPVRSGILPRQSNKARRVQDLRPQKDTAHPLDSRS